MTAILNFNPESERDPIARSSLRAVERHLHDDHYVRSIAPADFILEGGATTAVVNTRWGVVVLPDGSSTSGVHTYLRPSEWVLGKLKVKVWYSSPVASTNNFRVFLQVTHAKAGDVTTASPFLLTGAVLLPGPAVINTLLTHEVYSTVNVTRDMELLTARVQRTGAHADDTNVNDMHVYAVRVEMILATQEAT